MDNVYFIAEIIKCNDPIRYTIYLSKIKGGPVIVGDSLEETMKDFEAALNLSVAITNLKNYEGYVSNRDYDLSYKPIKNQAKETIA